jgi:hypothetical protein
MSDIKKCAYCHKEIELGKEVVRKVLINHVWKEKVFCCGECAGYEQMGAE